ncbi:FHA domain-containing protein [Vibrio profundum]|uniref:type VI secretion system-associated FHA domain protein n=1 Tax=Vibrio profundum TaxID=2910247 RepID=UPI003D133E67
MKLVQLVLNIAKYPDDYMGAKHIEIPESGGSIGRAQGCYVTLTDHNRFISSTHCLISVYGSTFYLSDVSTNGTLINGNKILKNQPVSLYDGDQISLGQYEVSVEIESIASNTDIAIDIDPSRDTADPLANLGELEVEPDRSDYVALGSLFEDEETPEDENDPIVHLSSAMQSPEESLLDDISSERQAPLSQQVRRQVIDDSDSISAEFDSGALIPEDWLGTETNQRETVPVLPIEKVTAPNVPNAPSVPMMAEQTDVNWEELNESEEAPPHIRNTQVNEGPHSATVSSADALPHAENGALMEAFLSGLGTPNYAHLQNRQVFFKQMGKCLRTCLDQLQSSLEEVEQLKNDTSESQPKINLADLMLNLHHKNLLSPHELVEQMCDELDVHQRNYRSALSEAAVEQLHTLLPDVVTNCKSSQFGLTDKVELWRALSKTQISNVQEFTRSPDRVIQRRLKEKYNQNTEELNA